MPILPYTTIVSSIAAFIVVMLTTPWLIKYLNKIGLIVKDMNKENKPLVPISGGLAVLAGIMAGLTLFMFFKTFLPEQSAYLVMNAEQNTLLFASMTTILLIAFIGFIDDLIIKDSNESSSGLKQWQKPLLTLTAAIPLMVVKAGFSLIHIPFIGVTIDFGILYPLVLVPIGVVGAANMVNLLAGFNGMETGMGIIYTGMLGLYTFVNERYLASLLALIVFTSLIAFYFYNKTPAKILPGDSLTYLLGATIAVIAIIGNVEKAALLASIPFIIEFLLKYRSKFKAQSYGYYKDGTIHSKYNKIYSLTHLFTRTGKYTEKQITYSFIFIELIFASLMWIL